MPIDPGTPDAAIPAEAIDRALEELPPDQRREVEEELRQIEEKVADLASRVAASGKNLEAVDALNTAANALKKAQGATLEIEIDELLRGRQDCEASIVISERAIARYRSETGARWAECDYGHGTTPADAIHRNEEELHRLRGELGEVNDLIADVVEGLWKEMYPEESLFSYVDGADVTPEAVIESRLWDEIWDAGLDWDARFVLGIEAREALGIGSSRIFAMRYIVEALRKGDVPQLESLLAKLAGVHKSKGLDHYVSIRPIRDRRGRLRLQIDQRPNPEAARCDRGTTQHAAMTVRRHQRGARSRCPRGKSTRTRGSRRVASRSAAGGSSGDDPPDGESEPARRRGLLGETQLFHRAVPA